MTWKRRAFLGCGLTAVGLPILGVGGSALWTWRTFGPDAAALEEEREAVRREGIAILPEDLRPKTPVPDALNAAIPIREAMRLWSEAKRKVDEAVFNPILKQNPTDAQRSAAQAVLRKLTPVLALAREAAQKPRCDFHYDFGKGAELLLPEMGFLRSLARLLCVSASLTNTADQAFSEIAAIPRLSLHAGSSPVVICGLVRVAMESIAHRQLMFTLSRFGSTGVAAARRALANWQEMPPFSYWLASESLMYDVTVRQLLRGHISLGSLLNGNAEYVAELPKAGPLIVRAWGTRGMQYWRETMPLIRANEYDPDRLRTALVSQMTRWHKRRDYRDILLATLSASYENTVDRLLVQGKVERSLRETALALIEANGKDVALPVDLYSKTGETLRLRREGDGFKLWSAGQDRIDDGGAVPKKSASGSPASENERVPRDLVFQYQPSKQTQS